MSALWATVCAVLVAAYFVLFRKPVSSHAAQEASEPHNPKKSKKRSAGKGQTQQRQQAPSSAKAKAAPEHPLLIRTLKGHSKPIASFAFSADGRYLATCSSDRTLRLTSLPANRSGC